MKTTTTLYEIIHAELIYRGHNEFFNKNQLSFYDNDYAFIKKIMRYDEDVEEIVNDKIFQNVSLETESSDKDFKKTFINRFFNREIAQQTLEAFSSQVVYTFLMREDYLNLLYDELEDYIQGKTTNDEEGKSKEKTDNRSLSSDLPQNEINLNVDDTVLNYGNENTITRTKTEKEDSRKSEQRQFNLDDLLKTKDLLEEIFIDFDRKCFMQVW